MDRKLTDDDIKLLAAQPGVLRDMAERMVDQAKLNFALERNRTLVTEFASGLKAHLRTVDRLRDSYNGLERIIRTDFGALDAAIDAFAAEFQAGKAAATNGIGRLQFMDKQRTIAALLSGHYVVIRKNVLMEDEGRHHFVEEFATEAEASAWITAQQNEYHPPGAYYVATKDDALAFAAEFQKR